MVPSAASNSSELGTVGRRRRLTTPADEAILGTRSAGSQNDDNCTLINNGTVVIEGVELPSVDISIRPNNPEHYCAEKLQFNWECTKYEELTLLV